MIKTFADKATRELYASGTSRRLPYDVARRALRRLEYIEHATRLEDLQVPPSNRLHALGGDRAGFHAIWVNDQWRICFRWLEGDAYDVELVDYQLIDCEVNHVSYANDMERTVRPTHPGEMLREDFMPDYKLTTATLATLLGVSRQTMNELVRERRAVSPEMALRLARLFGNSPEFWLNAQRAVDLWEAARTVQLSVMRISPLKAS